MAARPTPPRGVPSSRRWPLTSRLPPDHPRYAEILEAHEHALARGAPGYLDPDTGYLVFTAQAHWQRGRCCDSGCRHCPYAPGERGGPPEGS